MPQISRFAGIVVYMYYEDHFPPHLHAFYGEHEGVIEIETGNIYAGSMPAGELSTILNWMRNWNFELSDNWLRARSAQPLNKIPPRKSQ